MSPPPQSSSSLPSLSAAPAVAELLAAGHDAGEQADAAAAAAEKYEREHVHGVYEAIAPHFSSTRYKPWPAVAQFLNSQRPGAVGLDVGCGNGKYLGVNRSVYMVGSDRSSNLVSLARSHVAKGGKQAEEQQVGKKKGGKGKGEAVVRKEEEKKPTQRQPAGATTADVLVADGLSLPFRDRSADFVICVAVIHHMSTRVRRQDAIRQLLECVVLPPEEPFATGDDGVAANPEEVIARGGTVLVYVWALEQGSSRRGWDEGGEQDLLVPWVMKKSQAQVPGQAQGQGEGQKQSQGKKSGGSGGSQSEGQQKLNSSGAGGGDGNTDTDPDPSTVFNRYYHLYRKGELEEDVLAAGGVVVKSGYERDNWWVVCAPRGRAG
ncbi:S-adenosyl-L-methionine-dependent methyltransferase [Naviculisporaceae sp. PSN 640]